MRNWQKVLGYWPIAFSLALRILHAQPVAWIQTNGPDGGNIFSVAACTQGPLVATERGAGTGAVYYSHDDGSTWLRATGLHPGEWWMTELVANERCELFGVGDGGMAVWWSTDKGVTWKRKAPLPSYIARLVIDGAGNLLAAGPEGVWRSHDGGVSWARFSIPNLQGHVTSLVADPPSHIYLGTDRNGVYASSDNGRTWRHAGFAGNCINAIAVDLKQQVFVALCAGEKASPTDPYPAGVYRSRDRGTSWQYVAPKGDWWYQVSHLAPDYRGNLFAAGSQAGGVWRSADGGDTWIQVLSWHGAFNVVAPRRDGALFAGGVGGGVYRSYDGGLTWTQVKRGLRATWVRDLLANQYGVFATAADDGVFRSTDKGENWTQVLRTEGITCCWSLATNSRGYVYLGENVLERSRDAGATWQVLPLPPSSYPWLPGTVAVDHQDRLYMGGSGVARTSDDGLTWEILMSSPEVAFVTRIAFGPHGEIYAWDDWKSALWRSLDDGANWPQVFSGDGHGDFIVTDAGTLLLSAWKKREDGSVWRDLFRSADGGDTWSRLPWGEYWPPLCFALGPDGRIFAGTYNGEVIVSTDGGLTWDYLGTPAGNWECIHSIVVDDEGYVYVGTWGDGVWRSAAPVQ